MIPIDEISKNYGQDIVDEKPKLDLDDIATNYGKPLKKKKEKEDTEFELETGSLESPENQVIDDGLTGFKVEDLPEGVGAQQIDLTPIEDLLTSLDEKSQLTEDQKQYVEDQIMSGFEDKPVSATFLKTGISTGPSQTEYEKQKPKLIKEFAKVNNMREDLVTEDQVSQYFSNKKRKMLSESIIDQNREDYIADLTSSDKDKLEKYKVKKYDEELSKKLPNQIALNNLIADSYMGRVENGDYIDEAEKTELISKAYEHLDRASANTETLLTAEKEIDLLNRGYSTAENVVGKATASTLEILSGVNKFFRDIEPVLNPVGYAGRIATGTQEAYEKESEKIDSFLERIPEKIRGSLRKTKSVSEIRNVGDAVQWGTDIISETTPQVLTVMSTGGTGGITILASSAYGNKLNQLEKEEEIAGRELYSPFEKRTASALTAGAVFASEWVTKGILNKGKRVFESAFKEGLRGEVREGIKKSLTDKMKTAAKGLWVESDKEAWSEVGEQLSENIVDKYLLGKDINLYDGITDVYAAGKLMGLLMHSVPQVGAELMKPFVSQNTQEQLGNNISEIVELSKNYEDLSDATKVVIDEQVAEIDANSNKILNEMVKATVSLPKEKVAETLKMHEDLKKIKEKSDIVKKDPFLNDNQKKITLDNLDKQYSDLSFEKNKIIENSKKDINRKAQEKEGAEKFESSLTKELKPISEVEKIEKPTYKEEKRTVDQSIGSPVTIFEYGGTKIYPQEGKIYQENQQVVFENEDGDVFELGNIDDIKSKKLSDIGVKLTFPLEGEFAKVTPEGKIISRGMELDILSDLPTKGIEFDDRGGVKSVMLKDSEGLQRGFTGQVAEDISYQILLKEASSKENVDKINKILENEPEIQEQIRSFEKPSKKESDKDIAKDIRKEKEKPELLTKKPKKDVQVKQKDVKTRDQQKRGQPIEEGSFERRYKDEINVAKKEGIKGKEWTYAEGEFMDADGDLIQKPSAEIQKEFQDKIVEMSKEAPKRASIKEAKKVDISESIGLNKAISIFDDFDKAFTKAGKEQFSIGLPIVVAQGSVKTIKAGLHAGKTVADAISDGINYMRETDWYKDLTDKKKKHFDENFEEELEKARDEAVKEAEKKEKPKKEKEKKPVDKTKEEKVEKDEIPSKEEKSFTENDPSSLEAIMDNQRMKFQDSLWGIRKIQKEIEKQKGYKQEKIESDFDKAETLLHGKVSNKLKEQEKKVKEISKNIAKSKYDIHDVSNFMMAKHAEERNDDIMENKDPSNEAGSGMSTSDANEILGKYKGKDLKEMESLAKPLYDMIQDTVNIMEKHGLVSKDHANALRNKFKHYVPLQGFAIDESKGNEFIDSGSSLSVKGREIKVTAGRKTKAANVVSQIVAQNSNTINRAGKNDVLKVMHNLVRENPNKDVWQIFSKENPDTKRVFIEPKVKTNKSGEKIKTKGYFKQAPIDMLDNDNYVGLKIDGKDFFLKFANNRFGRNLTGANISKANALVKTFSSINRYLSSVLTSLNPEFMLANFTKDVQVAIYSQLAQQDISYNSVEGKDFIKKTLKRTLPSIRTIYRNEQGKSVKNERLNKFYNEFKEDGAKTGWFYSKGATEMQKDIEKMIELQSSKSTKAQISKGLQATRDLVENVNSAVENGVRLSTYVAAREAGVERTDAAKLAKELTVNFNRSGEYGVAANATYLFFNASMQGNVNFFTNIGTLKKTIDESGNTSKGLNKAQKLAAGMAVFSGMLTYLNIAMSEEDDDGVLFYTKIDDYIKERNMIIMKPDGEHYWKIPLPYGFNIFNNIGTAFTEVSMGERTAGNSIGFLANSLLGSFSPVPLSTSDTAEKTLLKSFIPTVIKPILELAINESYFNSEIYNKNYPGATPRPEAELGRRTTPQAFKNISKFLNEVIGGGSEYRSGSLMGVSTDINPDKIRYLYDFATGGVGKLIGNTVETTENLIKKSQGIEEDLPVGKIPFIRKIFGEPSKYVNQSKYFERKDEIGQLHDEYTEGKNVDKSHKRYKGVLKLNNRLKGTEYVLKGIRKSMKFARDIDDPIRRSKRINELDKKYYKQIAKFNKEYNKLRGE